MQNIIKDGLAIEDSWVLLRADAEGRLPAVDNHQDVIVPLRNWLGTPEAWTERKGRTAVWLSPDDEPRELEPVVRLLPLIAVDFPAFTDGRGYSLGRLLRERYNYDKELRALGDVWQDHLQALWQVGFDSFEIKQGKSLEACRDALKAFSDHYQCNYRQPLPWFRRSIPSV